MELGAKLRQARLEAGLTQRQLCGEEITRNMLSQIENGTAMPSLDTLRFLAAGLGKPVSWFLEEDTLLSPNQTVMDQARSAFAAGHYGEVRSILESYQAPDPLFDRERWLLSAMSALELAERALEEGRRPYALELLEQAEQEGARTPYFPETLRQQRLLLMALAGRDGELPDTDRVLLCRAERVMDTDPRRAGEYLDAVEDRGQLRWQLLRGRAWLGCGAFTSAAEHFRAAEAAYPREAAAALEHCCRELGDYKGAYEYACKLRELEHRQI